jgi:hypothetical protein
LAYSLTATNFESKIVGERDELPVVREVRSSVIHRPFLASRIFNIPDINVPKTSHHSGCARPPVWHWRQN